MFMQQNAPNRCEPSIEALNWGVRLGGGGGGGAGQDGCERRIKVLVKIRKIFFFFFFFFLGGGGGGSGRVGGVRVDVRVDVNREVKFL